VRLHESRAEELTATPSRRCADATFTRYSPYPARRPSVSHVRVSALQIHGEPANAGAKKCSCIGTGRSTQCRSPRVRSRRAPRSLGTVIEVQDIRARKYAEQALRESEERYDSRRIMPQMVWTATPTERSITSADKWRITSIRAREVCSDRAGWISSTRDRQPALETMAGVACLGDLYEAEFRLQTRQRRGMAVVPGARSPDADAGRPELLAGSARALIFTIATE
jgi:hypothetical protein